MPHWLEFSQVSKHTVQDKHWIKDSFFPPLRISGETVTASRIWMCTIWLKFWITIFLYFSFPVKHLNRIGSRFPGGHEMFLIYESYWDSPHPRFSSSQLLGLHKWHRDYFDAIDWPKYEIMSSEWEKRTRLAWLKKKMKLNLTKECIFLYFLFKHLPFSWENPTNSFIKSILRNRRKLHSKTFLIHVLQTYLTRLFSYITKF